MYRAITVIALAGLILAAGGQIVTAQESMIANAPPTAEFQFTRLVYGSGRDGYGRWRPEWLIDWPEAEFFFMQGLTRLTRVDGAEVSRYNGDGGRRVSLRDDAIFNFPWLYAVEVGQWYLDEYEAARLREYLLRGGFDESNATGKVKLDDYVRFDFRGDVRVWRDVSLYLAIDNLFNESYQEAVGVPSMGVRPRLGVRAAF